MKSPLLKYPRPTFSTLGSLQLGESTRLVTSERSLRKGLEVLRRRQSRYDSSYGGTLLIVDNFRLTEPFVLIPNINLEGLGKPRIVCDFADAAAYAIQPAARSALRSFVLDKASTSAAITAAINLASTQPAVELERVEALTTAFSTFLNGTNTKAQIRGCRGDALSANLEEGRVAGCHLGNVSLEGDGGAFTGNVCGNVTIGIGGQEWAVVGNFMGNGTDTASGGLNSFTGNTGGGTITIGGTSIAAGNV